MGETSDNDKENDREGEIDAFISLNVRSMSKEADKIKAALQAENIKVWICTDIGAGLDWRDELDLAIKKTKCFIILLNDWWCKSAECKNEYNYAKRLSLRGIDDPTP